ncbi:unnamed protein product [Effrenium voratum]|uniref:BRCT domain-containing protein n=1 Tax=Effrenium voratum TaxID=2562239 RepID=A0AA36N1R6_9DINO|nr:unnamed protein product [Effrenium voratum]
MRPHPAQKALEALAKDIDAWILATPAGGSQVARSFPVPRAGLFEELQRYFRASSAHRLVGLELESPDLVKVCFGDQARQQLRRSKGMAAGRDPAPVPAPAAKRPRKPTPGAVVATEVAPDPGREPFPAVPGREFEGVRVYLSEMLPDKENLEQVVKALGGSVVLSEATHGVFPGEGQLKMHSEWEELWLEARAVRSAKLVSPAWVQAVVEDGLSPWDSKKGTGIAKDGMPRLPQPLSAHEKQAPAPLAKSLQETQSFLQAKEDRREGLERGDEDLQKAIQASLRDFQEIGAGAQAEREQRSGAAGRCEYLTTVLVRDENAWSI